MSDIFSGVASSAYLTISPEGVRFEERPFTLVIEEGVLRIEMPLALTRRFHYIDIQESLGLEGDRLECDRFSFVIDEEYGKHDTERMGLVEPLVAMKPGCATNSLLVIFTLEGYPKLESDCHSLSGGIAEEFCVARSDDTRVSIGVFRDGSIIFSEPSPSGFCDPF